MKSTTISKGGQVSIPAEIRNPWGTRNVVLEDHGRMALLQPVLPDPIGAALRSLAGREPSSDALRRRLRDEEASSS